MNPDSEALASATTQTGIRHKVDGRGKTPWMSAALCFIVPVIPTISVPPGPLRGNGAPARLIALLCFALAVLAFLAYRRRGGHPKLDAGIILITAYLLLQLLVYAMGVLDPTNNPVIESSKTRAALSLIVMVGVALHIIRTVRTQYQRSVILGSLVAGLTYACVVGLLQNFSIADLRYTLVPPGFIEVLENANVVDRGGALRAVGTSSHAIEFSVLAASAVILSLHIARYGTKPIYRQLAAMACVVAFLAVPAGVSRSGVVALGVGLAVYMFSMNVRLLGNLAILGAGGLLVQKIISPSSINALWGTILGSQDDESIAGRTEDFAAVSEQFHRDPWFGLGLGGYPPSEYRFLDNEWLQSIVQGGIVGVVAMILLLVTGLAGMTSGLRNAQSPRDRDFTFAAGSTFIGVMTSSLTFDLFSFQQATFVLFICIGLLWTIRPTPDSHSTTSVRQGREYES